ncbi:MAG: NHL repeat-containing protein [Phycisphaerales bacterium]|nr:NHL repeat-containing protein [Phycisphaerales bacterium]
MTRQGSVLGWQLALMAMAALLLTQPLSVRAQSQKAIGWTYSQTVGDLDMPRAAAILPPDETGTYSVVLAERGGVRLLSGQHGQFDDPAGLTIFDDVGNPSAIVADGDQRIYIADADRHQIIVLDAWGAPLAVWGGPEELFEPAGLAIDEQRGVLYVADTGQHRIARYSLDGQLQGYWQGPKELPLKRPAGLAVAADGQLVVSDTGNHRLLIVQPESLSESVGPAQQVGQWGMYPGMLDEPAALQIVDGLIYVTERRNHRVQVFDMAGQSQGMWGKHALMPHQGEGKLHYPDQFLVAPDGTWAMVVEGLEDRMQVFKPGDPLVAPAGPQGILAQETKTHFGAHPAISGELLVIPDPETHQVYVFRMTAREPILITQFGMRGTGAGRFMDLSGLSVNGQTIEVLDPSTSRLAQFRLDWKPEDPLKFDPLISRLVKSRDFGEDATAKGQRGLWLGAMVLDDDGRRFMIDQANAEILVIDSEGKVERRFGQSDLPEQSLSRPTALVLDQKEQLYIVDATKKMVFIFGVDGQFVGTFGGPDVLESPFGVTVVGDRVYVTDRATGEIVVFDVGDDQVVQRIAGPGGRGFDVDQMFKPSGIVHDHQGRLIVLDEGNHRGQIWSPQGQWLVTFGLGRSYTPDRRPRPIPSE